VQSRLRRRKADKTRRYNNDGQNMFLSIFVFKMQQEKTA
jgi:hypothetical protein